MRRYNALSSHFRARFGRAVRKVALDAGGTCPNRDGTVGSGGCVFCDARGSGTGLAAAGLSLADQWGRQLLRASARRPRERADLRLAYLQSYSTTHGPLERLEALLDEVLALPGLAGICLGTRPEGLDAQRLDLLTRTAARLPAGDLWLDMGLQSASDATLAAINRGHTFGQFVSAVKAAGDRGLRVCAHLMAGLPGEGPEDFLASVSAVGALPVSGIKLHNLLVIRGTAMESAYLEGRYRPLVRSDYVATVVTALERLRPDVVIHRLQADAKAGELLAPAWAADKAGLLTEIHAEQECRDSWQGKALGAARETLDQDD